MNNRICLLVLLHFSVNHSCVESDTLFNSVYARCNSISNMGLLKNVAGNFGVSFQENQLQVSKVTCNFYLWGNLKYKVYKNNPHTLEELRNNTLFIKHRRNALHFTNFFFSLDPYICFGLCKTHHQGVLKTTYIYIQRYFCSYCYALS
jgi:hypothetical protein